MKLSLIVPVYNTRDYVSECLESLIGQTWRDIEIICVNDGSTDDSARILQEYAWRCLLYTSHQSDLHIHF